MVERGQLKIGAIIQARASSARLPGKIFKELPYDSGITVLQQVIRRTKRAKRLALVVVATTTRKEDNTTAKIVKKEGVGCFRGSEKDVLTRFYDAAKENKLDIIVRICADCPCVDVDIIDHVIKKHLQQKVDYTSNCLKKTYSLGFNVEVFNFLALRQAYTNAFSDDEREHVTPYIYNNPRKFKIETVKASGILNAPEIRITLDTKNDYVLLCAIYDFLWSKRKYFKAIDIIRLFKKKPWLRLINEDEIQKRQSPTLKDEVREAIRVLDKQDLKKAANFIKRHFLNKF